MANKNEPGTPTLVDLNQRARILLSELQTFREHLRAIKQESNLEIAHFRATVKSELSMLERLAVKPHDDSTNHIARSSNVPFLETVWSTAKTSKHLVALQKRVFFNSPSKSLSQSMHHIDLGRDKPGESGKRNAAVTVDTISDSGLIWTKVSLVTNTRLLFDLAKQGWQSDDSHDDEGGSSLNISGEDVDIPLVRNTRELCHAALSFRVRTKKPVVHILLPRIILGEADEVDAIVEQCKAIGAKVVCGEYPTPVRSLHDALSKMAPDPLSLFSGTLNIDCTILLALVSEFSHAKVAKEPWFHKALQRQVEIEGNENLLPSLLYPALGEHRLVCTAEAAKRMREIVATIGTSSEKARTAIMLGDDGCKGQEDLVREMQELSAYPVPRHWQLPIRVLDTNENDLQSRLPSHSQAVRKNMTTINQSVFLYGWAAGCTTITSNRAVVKQLESDLEKFTDLDASTWPSIWLCPTARSLVGKEKRGAKKEDKKEGIWPLPDHLKREQERRNGLDVLSSRNGHEAVDLRPNGYPCDEVLEAKNAARHRLESETDICLSQV